MTLRRFIVLAAVVAMVAAFIAVDGRSHSVSDTFYGLVVPEAAILMVATALLLATRLSARGRP